MPGPTSRQRARPLMFATRFAAALGISVYLIVSTGCEAGPTNGPTVGLAGCVAEPHSSRVGRPNQTSRLRLLNGWRWAGRDAVARAGAAMQTIRVPTRRATRRLVLRTSLTLESVPQARMDGAELEVRRDTEVVEIVVPGSDRLKVGTLSVNFPVGTVLVDSRVLPGQGPDVPTGTENVLQPGEWARCIPRRLDIDPAVPVRIDIPGLSVRTAQVFVAQGEQWQRLDHTERAIWELPEAVDLDRAVVVVENVGAEPLVLPASSDGAPQESETREAGVRPRAVLVFVMDALRARTAERLEGLDGFSAWRDLVAEGVSLRRHFAVAPNTLPSTKALFTGRVWPQQGGWALRPEQGPTLAEAYREAGYRTAMFSNNPYVSADFGVDRGFDHVVGGEVELEARNDDSRQLVDAAEAWLESLPAEPDERPVFLYLHVLQPHNPYRPGSESLARLARDSVETIDGGTATLLDISRGRRTPNAAETQRLRDLYAAQMIEAVEQLVRLRRLLEERFGASNTLIVATSDHGEEILEHDSALHGYTLFDEMIRIPALFAGTGIDAGGRSVESQTDTTDVHCWLRSLALGDRPCRLDAPLSTGPRIDPTNPKRVMSAAASVKGGIFAIRSPRTKFVFAPQRGSRWGFGSGRGRTWRAESLYDLVRDPGELNDLLAPGASTADDAFDLQRLRLELEVWVTRQTGLLDEETDDGVVDPAVERRLRGLGYVQ